MEYYQVWVRSNRYHGHEPLTYSSEQRLNSGTIVEVELQHESVLGVISGPTVEPRFKTKPIIRPLNLPPLPLHLLRLAKWLIQYYPAPLGIISQQLLPAGLSDKQKKEVLDLKFVSPELNKLPKLTSDQQRALSQMSSPDTYLLHGITGSGKTRLYIELAARAIAAGRSSIILTPEISLTTQLADSFSSVFGERIIVLHSQQTPAERQRAWSAALQTKQPVIIIGPRSALFAPLQKIGLIVLDEAHESAYKQQQAPQYQTGRVAAYLSSLTHATLVLGSATPSVSDYYLAQQKKKPIINLTHLAQSHSTVANEIELVDRKDHGLFSRSSFLSQPLIRAIETSLSRGEQSLLYLNRRGTARLVLCDNCGWQAACPHCDVPLTYHADDHSLRCHSCNYHAPAPSSCPQCNNPSVVYKTAGTKAIVSEAEKLFPGTRVSRFDTDNLKADRFEQQYHKVRAGEVDILVGTQMLAKGLDLPRLSTLGILLADTSLYLPDFSSQERTFQLIAQVLGRIGRGHIPGRAVIQSYHPDHPVIVDAINGDYTKFYKNELAGRQQFSFPPFCYLLKLSLRRSSIASAELSANKLKDDISRSPLKVQVEGPAPSFYERFKNKYQWQLVVKASSRTELLKVVELLPSGWSYDIDPLDLL